MRLSVGRKLVGGLLLIMVVIFGSAVAALDLAEDANSASQDIHREEVIGLVDLAMVVDDANEMRRRGLLHVLSRDAEEQEVIETEMADIEHRLEEGLLTLEADWRGQEAKLLLVERLREEWDAYMTDRERTLELSREGRFNSARKMTTGLSSDSFRRVMETVDQLIALNERSAGVRLERTQSSFEAGRRTVLAAIVATGLLGLIVALLLARSIARKLGNVAGAATNFANGNLDSRTDVRSGDEIGVVAAAFNTMADQLQQLIDNERRSRETLERAVSDYASFAESVATGDLRARLSSNGTEEIQTLTGHLNGMAEGLGRLASEVRGGAHDIASAASEILATVSQHTSGATQQQAAITETSATVEEIRAAAEQVAEKAREMEDSSQASLEASVEATDAVRSINEGMATIRERVEAIAQQILDLSEQTQRIGEITETVNDLADQSNLLALNATIEAAKAGEHGKGFAVVADEVRNLAEQSKRSAGQVQEILSDIRKGADSAVLTTEQGTRVVEEGSRTAGRAGELIEQLADVIRSAADAAQQITAATYQQRIGMDQIAHAMSDIDQATNQFVAGASQSQTAATDLADLAGRLQDLTERYKIGDELRVQ